MPQKHSSTTDTLLLLEQVRHLRNVQKGQETRQISGYNKNTVQIQQSHSGVNTTTTFLIDLLFLKVYQPVIFLNVFV